MAPMRGDPSIARSVPHITPALRAQEPASTTDRASRQVESLLGLQAVEAAMLPMLTIAPPAPNRAVAGVVRSPAPVSPPVAAPAVEPAVVSSMPLAHPLRPANVPAGAMDVAPTGMAPQGARVYPAATPAPPVVPILLGVTHSPPSVANAARDDMIDLAGALVSGVDSRNANTFARVSAGVWRAPSQAAGPDATPQPSGDGTIHLSAAFVALARATLPAGPNAEPGAVNAVNGEQGAVPRDADIAPDRFRPLLYLLRKAFGAAGNEVFRPMKVRFVSQRANDPLVNLSQALVPRPTRRP